MTSVAQLYFGVEVELLIGSRKKSHPTWRSLATELSKKLEKAGVENQVNEANVKSPEIYAKWSIAPEVTIPGQPAKGLYGLELVSPVYPSDWTWAQDIEAIFGVIHASFTVVESTNCSTHVHVSSHQAMDESELAVLSKAILLFEPALDALVPPSRRGSTAYWCQSNRANPLLSGRTTADCLLAVDHAAVGGAEGLVAVMNMFPAASGYGRANRKKHDFVRGKVYKWDLTGLLGPRGTLEFRQPPGSTKAADARAWVELALAFVEGSRKLNSSWPGEDGAVEAFGSVEELWELLCDGAAALGMDGAGITGLFTTRQQ